MSTRTEELIRYTNELAEDVAKVAPDMYLTILSPERLRWLSPAELLEFAEHFGVEVYIFLERFEAKVTINGVIINAATDRIDGVKVVAPSAMDVLRATVSQAKSIAA